MPPSRSWWKTSRFVVILALVMAISASPVLSLHALSPATPSAVTALQFDGTNDYVTFGAAPGLGLSTFTIETWFRRDGTGVTTTTGTGGVTSAIPLVTKGRGEAEGSNVDMNWFLGINNTTGTIAADFEDMATGGNHPVNGVTVIQNGVWYHAAVTYDGTTWRLYLNGSLEATTAANAAPRSDSIQHAAIGSAQNSTGAAAGFLNGAIDEVRIWNVVRTQQEIRDNLGQEVTTGTGLVARWGMSEGSGTTINGTGSGVVPGTLTNGPTWVAGTPFQLTTVFRDGLNSYTGTADTFLLESTPTTSYATDPAVGWDTEDTAGDPATRKYGLIRFDNIFGTSPGQILDGSTIVSAVLTYTVSNNSVNVYDLNEVAIDWLENVTYNAFGSAAGVDPADYGALVASVTPSTLGPGAVDVTASLATWTTAPALNRGWIFHPTGADGADIRSSDYTTTLGERPTLRVVYTLAPPPTNPPAAPTGLLATPTIGTQIHLQWADNAADETNFEIERSTTGSGGPFGLLASVSANVVTYQDNGLSSNTEYCYQVRARNAAGPSPYTNAACATTPVNPNNAIDFGGTNAYVTFGDPAALDVAQFTVETWFRRDGAGVGVTTGSGGIPSAVPLVTHGTSQADGSNVDMNYFLGVETATNKLVADFEEGPGGAGPVGLNHPVTGTTTIQNGVWYHAAATYDGSRWQLFLNGNLEAELVVGQPVRADSIQHAALGSSLRSDGITAQGFFDGVLDEARVWNSARTQAQIRSTLNSQLATPQTGLVARWGLNEGSGTLVGDTSGNLVNGTVTNNNYQWVLGAPFNINFAPDAPTLNAPANGSTVMTLPPTLGVDVNDPDSINLTVTFYGRALNAMSNQTFTLVALPDTQFYSANYPQVYVSQTQWIVDNQVSRNIAFVMHEGDIVNDSTVIAQWTNADAAMDLLDAANIPYSVTPGNHDEVTNANNFNTYFGVTRFQGKSYYGGQYPAGDNQNSYALFSAGGLDFIVINLDYISPAAGSLDWADNLLKNHSTRRGIVVSHDIIYTGNPGGFSAWGQNIYNTLKDNANLFLMLNGHTDGEGRRIDIDNGHTVHSLLADYQGRAPNGGNGWLRLMEFAPAQNQIRVQTYSPYLDQFETDANSFFTLTYPFTSAFQLIGTVNATSGSTANLVWPGLSNNTEYEWYAVVSDGSSAVNGSINRFTVGDFAYADNDDVCAGNEPCFSTIQDALNHVTTGPVTIYDGTYNESLILNKNATVSLVNGAVLNLNGAFNLSAGTFNANNGTLNLTGDFTVSGGTFNAGTGAIGFNGATAQNLNLNAPIIFNHLTVGSGVTLIETSTPDYATVSGALSNNGVIRKIKTIGGSGPLGMGLTGVQLNVQTPGTLSALTIDRIDQDHPQAANNNLRTGRYWSITPTGSGYAVDLTLPHNNVIDPKACRYTGGAGAGYDCAADSSTASTVTRLNVTAFSEWTVSNHTGPTAVKLKDLKALDVDRAAVWPWLIACALLGGVTLGVLTAWRRRMQQH